MANLVDSMMMEMEQNNSQADMNYHPAMMQHVPIQPQQQVRMGEVSYVPPGHMQQPPMMQQERMVMPEGPMGEQEPQLLQPETPESPELEADDLDKYGMEDDEPSGWMDQLMNEAKAPLIVIALAFIMSMPQVNSMVRNGLYRFTANMMYINVIQAVLIGLAFYMATKLL